MKSIVDPDYYVASYGRELLHGKDPSEHFVETGFANGLKPRPTLDPLVFKHRHPDLRGKPLFEKFVASASESSDLHQVTALLEQPLVEPESLDPERPGIVYDPRLTIAHARNFSPTHRQPFEAAGRRYELVAPSADALYERFEQDRPVTMTRLSHGDWDGLYYASHYARQIRSVLDGRATDREVEWLSYRLCEQLMPGFDYYAEHFIPELLDDLRSHPRHPDFWLGISFKGSPTYDENIFDGGPPAFGVDFERLEIFARFFDPDEALYDGTLFKRWLLSGDLAPFPEHARRRPVILMGAKELASLGERWQLPWFDHIVIPKSHSFPMRRQLLEICRERIAEAKAAARRMNLMKPLFLVQGSSFAYWFQTRLFATDPDVFYLDFGQALHAWFYDLREIGLWPWGERFAPTIVRNCRMADYYANLGVRRPVVKELFSGRVAYPDLLDD